MTVILEAERETLKLRLLAIAAIAAGLYTRQQQTSEYVLIAAAIICIYLVYALALRRFIIPLVNTEYFVYAMIVIDALVLLFALHTAGGLESNLFVLFPVYIILYAIYLDYYSAFFAATVISFLLAGYALFSQITSFTTATAVAFQVPLLFLLAYLSGFLARRAKNERQKREALQDLIRIESGTRGLREIVSVINRAVDIYEEWTSNYVSQTPEKEAIEKLRFSLSIDAQYALAHYAFGVLYSQTGQLSRALDAFAKAINLDPNLVEAYRGLSEVLIRMGRFQEALDSAQQYASAAQHEWQAHQNLALIYNELGMIEESRQAEDVAISLSTEETRDDLQTFFHRMRGEVTFP